MKGKMLFIGEVAKKTGVNPKAIRFYEEIDLLPKARRGENNYRMYSQDDIRRIDFIKKAQSLGFTLRDIREILALRDRGVKPCNHVSDLLKQRIVAIDEKLAELNNLRGDLKLLQNQWKEIKTIKEDRGEGICPQIERIKVRITKKPSKPFYSRK